METTIEYVMADPELLNNTAQIYEELLEVRQMQILAINQIAEGVRLGLIVTGVLVSAVLVIMFFRISFNG